MGRYSDAEKLEEAFYVAQGLEIVAELWETHNPQQIAAAIRLRTGYECSARLVCSLKQRMDRERRSIDNGDG